ncbi:hypothetical protein CPLU01_13460 [Colletotrichum plurivorum]|uniref:Fungal N-terminal domain-containing protein n=1 Tax=Colletotrichum plurivorum TaxID=2175906 RepID=A0A8H6JSH6_9PEZI|nr:hypothetical protein CPLU01_13460 [Colletotrichum plurivorum]
MAEVLGTVVGVVSLGIQLSSGIMTYLDGIQCREEDIDSTKRRCRSMEALLKEMESLRLRLPPPTALTNTNGTALEESMTSAKAELSLLADFMAKISPSDALPSPKTAIKKLREQKRKLLYPFRRDHLDHLDSRLEAANTTLRAALQLAQLY